MGNQFLPDLENSLKNPLSATIYIDVANSNKYFVDVPCLPYLTPERVVQMAKSTSSNMTS
jgi:hypothetical protein